MDQAGLENTEEGEYFFLTNNICVIALTEEGLCKDLLKIPDIWVMNLGRILPFRIWFGASG